MGMALIYTASMSTLMLYLSPSQKLLSRGRETEVKAPHISLRQFQMSRHCATR